jgi:LAS superfamily LD-carboxypeptidase LdcB
MGLSDSHVIEIAFTGDRILKIHPDVAIPLQQLAEAAKNQGFQLQVASAFRSFDRQLDIWNRKARGTRPLLSADENLLEINLMPRHERIYAILHWSALPGGSRHHWGTEIDIYDARALPKGQKLELSVRESQTLFVEFYCWLDEYLQEQDAFVRPYLKPDSAIACEPWHLSYRPIASQYERSLSLAKLTEQLRMADLELFDVLEAELPSIFSRYIQAYFVGGNYQCKL